MACRVALLLFFGILAISCEKEGSSGGPENGGSASVPVFLNDVETIFQGKIRLDSFADYSLKIPTYIDDSLFQVREISNAQATLGRVLFFDRKLSSNNFVNCAKCHEQRLGFNDPKVVSEGVNGETNRHSMRLVNGNFSVDLAVFWDERAIDIEHQVIEPIQDHLEMGNSGIDGEPNLEDLLDELRDQKYYTQLFAAVYGDPEINVSRIEQALGQFVRSIYSFDSRYDEGRILVGDDMIDFPNYIASENRGKKLFMQSAEFNEIGERIAGGVGCNNCHQAPSFSIRSDSGNNGVINNYASASTTTNITRAPNLRDIFSSSGTLHTSMMHNGLFLNFRQVIDHYNSIPESAVNNQIDSLLVPNGFPQRLLMTDQEKEDLEAFMKTLSGNSLYSQSKWSDPF